MEVVRYTISPSTAEVLVGKTLSEAIALIEQAGVKVDNRFRQLVSESATQITSPPNGEVIGIKVTQVTKISTFLNQLSEAGCCPLAPISDLLLLTHSNIGASPDSSFRQTASRSWILSLPDINAYQVQFEGDYFELSYSGWRDDGPGLYADWWYALTGGNVVLVRLAS